MRSANERYQKAMKVETQAEADAYFEDLVEEQMLSSNCSREQAENVERANLGYFAGYYDNQTRERVERLFRCAHPIFGPIAQFCPPSATEALAIGRRLSGVTSERQENVGVTCRKCGTSWITANDTAVFRCIQCNASVRGPNLKVFPGRTK